MVMNMIKQHTRKILSGIVFILTASLCFTSSVRSDAGAGELNLQTATILDLQAAYDDGLKSEQVVEAYLKRIAAYDQQGPAINSILYLNPKALEVAKNLDEERACKGPRSLLHGVPILIKDNYDTFDMPTTGGAKALAGTYPLTDAYTIERLRKAGAILLAKTNMDEFARGSTGTSSLGGQVLNPYNLEKIPGGSSGGSGAGVAALFGWVGLGTETGSSIRNPSTKNNLVGFSPSEGLVSRRGIIPISITYDRAGPMARSVTDAAITMSFMLGVDPGDLFTYGGIAAAPEDNYLSALNANRLAGARIGIVRDLFGTDPEDAPAVALIEQAIEVLKEKGAIVIDPIPTGVPLWQMVRETSYGGGERRPALEYYFSTRGPDFPIKTMAQLAESGGILGRLKSRYETFADSADMSFNPEYVGSYPGRYRMRAFIEALMERWQLDALVYPHQTKPVNTIAESVTDGGNGPNPTRTRVPGEGNRLSTVTGMPTVVVPVGFDPDGISVGMEFLGKLYDEKTVISLAYSYEQAAPNRKLPPTTPNIGVEIIKY